MCFFSLQKIACLRFKAAFWSKLSRFWLQRWPRPALQKNMWLTVFVVLVFPASSNYSLRNFGFGAGGSEDSSSSNYNAHVILGETSETTLSGSNYDALPGAVFTLQASTPPAPTFENEGTDYNKLLITLNVGDNPSDAQFAIAISDDSFTTTNYVQSDNTIGDTLGSEDWQTYTAWGGASGESVIDLEPGTTYYVKVKARHGDFTEGPWGPTASAATSSLTLSFDIDVSSSDEETASPYVIDLSTLGAGSVTTGSDRLWVDLSTNAAGGGVVYVYGSNSGLHSTTTNYTISAVSGNLSSLDEGFGLQSASVAESSGGPLAAVSPYDGSNEVVGTLTTVPQPLFDSSSAPITSGRGSVVTKAKITDITPAATDYSETVTVIAAALF